MIAHIDLSEKYVFLKKLIAISIPIVLNNILSAAIGITDIVMLNYVGQDQMAAVSLANQPPFVLNLLFMGHATGISVMIAQYLGNGDRASASGIFSFGLKLTMLISIAFFLLAFFLPSFVMCVFTNEERLIDVGGSYLRVAVPAMFQGIVWGGAMSALSAIMGRLGTDFIAANSLAATVQNLVTIISFGLAEGGCILLGYSLGKSRIEQAKQNSCELLKMTICVGCIGGISMLLMEDILISALNISSVSVQYFQFMYRILSVNVVFASVTYTILNGILPSGGDTRFGLYVDSAVMWGWCVVMSSVCAFVLELHPLAVFVVANLDEVIKTPISIARYLKGKWANDLTDQEGIL